MKIEKLKSLWIEREKEKNRAFLPLLKDHMDPEIREEAARLTRLIISHAARQQQQMQQQQQQGGLRGNHHRRFSPAAYLPFSYNHQQFQFHICPADEYEEEVEDDLEDDWFTNY